MARYRFIETDNKVICISTFAKKVVRGIAKCSPNDNFNIEIGRKLAQLRCDEKIAKKRMERAILKYGNALDNFLKARDDMNMMADYKESSINRYNDVVIERKKFEKTI